MIKEIQKLKRYQERKKVLRNSDWLDMALGNLLFFSPLVFLAWILGAPFWYSVGGLVVFSSILSVIFFIPLRHQEDCVLGLEEMCQDDRRFYSLFESLSKNLKTNEYIESLISSTLNSAGRTYINNKKLEDEYELNRLLRKEISETLIVAAEKLYERRENGEYKENLEQLKYSL
jgi:hypothetical protein